MKILHVTPYYWPAVRYGGPIFSIAGMCRSLVARGHEVHVYTTSIDGMADSAVELEKPVDVDGVKVTYFPSKSLRRIFLSPSMKVALQRNINEFDLLHLHTVYTWPVYVAAMVARSAGVPYLLAPRGMLDKDLMRRKSRLAKTIWLQLFGRKQVSYASIIHVTSKREADDLKTFQLNLPPLVQVPNGIDFPNIQAIGENRVHRWGKQEYVLFIGRINWEKGLDRLIRAWRYGLDIPLVIAGNDEKGYTSRLRALAKDACVSDKIHFIGAVDGNAKWELYQQACLMVLPSYSENFGNVVLEAMAVGCPVVVTPEVGLADAVKKYGAGVVVDGDPQKLAAGIRQLITDKERRKKMGRKGMEAARAHYSWPAIAEQMESVYKDLVKSGN